MCENCKSDFILDEFTHICIIKSNCIQNNCATCLTDVLKCTVCYPNYKLNITDFSC